MLEKMREGSNGPLTKIILGMIILSFALAGAGGYLGGSNIPVAVIVNGEEISQANVDQAYQNERARLQQQYGTQFEILASTPNFTQQVRKQVTETLISDALIKQAIDDLDLRVGDEQVKNAIRNMREFKVDGKFNNEQYLALLRRASYTPIQFSQTLKQDLARRQLLQMLQDSEFVLPNEIDVANKLQAQQRIAKVLMVNATDFVDIESVSAEEINTYYQNNSELFQSLEQVSVEYVLLDSTTLAAQITVTEADLEAYYEEHNSDYQRAERRKVAHILVQGLSDKTKQKAQDILDEINSGSDFGALAIEKSDDTYSAKNNGELDWFEAGVMDPAFDKASFALTKESPISQVIESTFGYHIIKLMDIEKSEVLALAEIKGQVEVAVQNEKTSELYYELHQTFSEVAFESPDNLEEAAGAISAQVQRSSLFSANNAPLVLNNRALLQIVFDQNFRDEGLNSELIELSENKSIVVRVNDHKEATLKPLDEVKKEIESDLTQQKSQQLAKQFVQTLTTKLTNNESIEADLLAKNFLFSEEFTFSRSTYEYDRQLIQQLFKLNKPTNGNASFHWLTLSTGDFAVIEFLKVIDADTEDDASKTKIENMLTRSMSEQSYQSLVAQLMTDADIKYIVED